MAVRSALTFATIVLTLMTGCKRSSVAADTQTAPRLKALLAKNDSLHLIDRYKTAGYVEPQKPTEVTDYHITTTWTPGSLQFEPVVVTDVTTGEKTKGAQVAIRSEMYTIGSEHGGGKEAGCSVDDDELSDLVKAIDYVQDQIPSLQPSLDHTRQIRFRTRDGLNMSLEQDRDGKPEIFFASDADEPVVQIQVSALADLKSAVQQVVTTLQQH